MPKKKLISQLTKIVKLSASTWSYIGCNTFWLNSVKISTADNGDEDLEPPKVYSESAKVECSLRSLENEDEERLLVWLSFSSQVRSGECGSAGESGVVESGCTIRCAERPLKYSGNIASKAFVHWSSWSWKNE